MSELVAKRLMDAASSFLKRRTRERAIRECAYVACLINLNKSRGNDCLLTRHDSHREQLMIHVSGRQYADNSSGWVARCVNGNFHFLATRRRDNRPLKEILPLLISSCRTLTIKRACAIFSTRILLNPSRSRVPSDPGLCVNCIDI